MPTELITSTGDHKGAALPDSQGHNSTWDATVRQFDVEAYAADAAATGAKYAFITVMQDDQYMIAPNARFDSLTGYKPGEACATRDLVLDLWAALDKRGLKLGLYWTGDGPGRDPKVRSLRAALSFAPTALFPAGPLI